ncbi:zinc-dependent alcohol dehydrogenase family protein [Promethearchaeum syntrophicum]|uniref:Zinc-dependent alcohol dehydrogenase family protein n=1 Tax=Promethearchaeum syntrophicum TaxID=2594042 RepID=A0A5B9DF41_9ARCH|nr:zinc-dependent alcohol dehydrogenase family protein [Candidatus Prometheoarchaeum syntrophicum]QEE17346.1 NAD-dependent alcohol dehydrogenase [Candidatus Prometheoarchaeum syntrophicum]
MKAMVLRKTNTIEKLPLIYTEILKPEPQQNEIRIKIRTCGVCHTDLHEIEGDLPTKKLNLVPGHEIIGIVDKCGINVENFSNGDRVGVPWLYSACGTCKYCKRGQENLCDNAKFTGYNVNGGYAEYMVVSSNFAYKIPLIFSDAEAAPLMCAGVIGYRSIRLSQIKPGETLGLFGFGASAHIVIQIALYWKCKVFVFTRSKNHQEHARKLGASWVGTSKDNPPRKIDSAISFVPSGLIIHDILRVLDKGGTLAINAIHLTDIPAIQWNLLYYERQIISVANTTRQDAIEFLKLAGEIPIKIEVQTYNLKDANKALQDLKNSKFNGAAVLLIEEK